jgi:hypothetical protein
MVPLAFRFQEGSLTMISMMAVALTAIVLAISVPALAETKGTLAPGAKVEVATDADGFNSFIFEHDGKKTVVMQLIGPDDTKEIPVDPNQKVGFSRPYHGKKVTIVNTGDVEVRYEVN